MSKENYFNVFDFGDSKIRFSVFDFKFSEKYSETKLVSNENKSVNKFSEIKNIIKRAENKISSHIEDVILALDNSETLTIEISLYKNLDFKSQTIKIYNSILLELKQLVELNYSNFEIIHIVIDNCIIDNKIYYELPQNILDTNNIKIDFKIICFPKNLILNLKENFNKNNLNIKKIFCTSYIKSLSYLRKLNLKNVSFLEIGYRRTSLISYEENKLKFIQSIPIGGFHITNDISKVFNFSIDVAEKIKKSFNKKETEFSYSTKEEKNYMTTSEILNKKISLDLLKKVILYRVQEIIDIAFEKSNIVKHDNNFKNADVFLIGDGSLLFDNNSFYLNDKFEFNSINFFGETDTQICNSVLIHYLNNYEIPKINKRKRGLFERFFNYFSK
tara:strand:- start:2263 stop:3426 length:1164 start_codon:yes stop_codon:yes gene_type:complete